MSRSGEWFLPQRRWLQNGLTLLGLFLVCLAQAQQGQAVAVPMQAADVQAISVQPTAGPGTANPVAVAAVTGGPPVCLDSDSPPLSELPPVPAEVHSGSRVLGVVIARFQGAQVWVQAQDAGLLNLTSACAAGQYLLLPAGLHAQLDPDTLVLNVTVTEIGSQTNDPDAPLADSPQTTGTLVNATAALSATGNSGGGLPGGQVAGSLSLSTDSRIWNGAAPTSQPQLSQPQLSQAEQSRAQASQTQPVTPGLQSTVQQASGAASSSATPPAAPESAAPQALGVRTSSDLGVVLGGTPATAPAPSPAASASLYGAYAYWQAGGLETQVGLIPAEQLGPGALQGSPLVGAALRRTSGADLRDVPLRLESPGPGSYRILYRGVVLKQGTLDAGTTLLRDIFYPPVQDMLTVEISDESGANVLRRYAVPFDRRPLSRPVGTADYVLAAGYRDAQPSFSASASYTSSADTELQGGLTLGARRGVQLGLRYTPGAQLAVGVDASLLAGPTDIRLPTQGETRQGSLSLGLSRSADWGSLTVRASVQENRAADPADRELGHTSSLGVQASVFLVRPALQLEGGIDRISSGDRTSSEAPSMAPGAPPVLALTSTLRAHLGLSGSLRLGPSSGPLADWNVRVYAAQTTAAGTDPVGQLGVSVGLNLGAFERLPGLTVQTGVQDGQPLLAVQQNGQRGDLNLNGTVRVLPSPGLSAQIFGPYSATFDLVLGSPPMIAASGSAALALTGGLPRLLPSGTRQAITVNVGVPGVQVRAGGVTATTDASGRASLPLSPFLRQTDVEVLLNSLPLSTSLSVLSLRVQPVAGALVTVADFTPYLTRTNLRQLPASVPVGATARLTGSGQSGQSSAVQTFTVQDSRYVQFDARNGDRIAVSWPGGSCTAVWGEAELLVCR
ncbi:hypothetical protein [Deinococcus altitudinis]|uniref:hypothetical protein n=1 Tax=Deinococcus altitudinis TaxID=468914 RepID=UPI003892AD24